MIVYRVVVSCPIIGQQHKTEQAKTCPILAKCSRVVQCRAIIGWKHCKWESAHRSLCAETHGMLHRIVFVCATKLNQPNLGSRLFSVFLLSARLYTDQVEVSLFFCLSCRNGMQIPYLKGGQGSKSHSFPSFIYRSPK